jgi:hypothetical protein
MITFDGPNKVISYDDAGTQVAIDAADLYSRWKDWVALGNAQYPAAFRTIGGDPLGGGIFAGAYFFLNNTDGWRIRPKEAAHELVIAGNLYPENAALPTFLPTVGAYNVQTRLALSSLTQSIAGGSGGGLTTPQDTRLTEVHRRLGLEAGTPVVVTPTTLVAGDIEQSITEAGTTRTVERA